MRSSCCIVASNLQFSYEAIKSQTEAASLPPPDAELPTSPKPQQAGQHNQALLVQGIHADTGSTLVACKVDLRSRNSRLISEAGVPCIGLASISQSGGNAFDPSNSMRMVPACLRVGVSGRSLFLLRCQ